MDGTLAGIIAAILGFIGWQLWQGRRDVKKANDEAWKARAETTEARVDAVTEQERRKLEEIDGDLQNASDDELRARGRTAADRAAEIVRRRRDGR